MAKFYLKLVMGLITGTYNIKDMAFKWGGDDIEYCRLVKTRNKLRRWSNFSTTVQLFWW